MRDDTRNLLQSLIALYSKKQALLEVLSSNLSSRRHFLKTGNAEKLLEEVELDQEYIDAIDIIDFDIRQTTEKLCRIFGIDINAFYDYISKQEGELFRQLHTSFHELKSILQKYESSAKPLIYEIENRLNEVGSQMRSLRHIKKLKSNGG